MDKAVDAIYYPITNKWNQRFHDLAQKQIEILWTVDIMNSELREDIKIWPTLPPLVRDSIEKLVAYFSCIDTFACSIANNMQKYESSNIYIQKMFSAAALIETIHAEMYGLFPYMIYSGKIDQIEHLKKVLVESKPAQAMVEWANTYANNHNTDPRYVALGALCFEAILIRPFFIIPVSLRKSPYNLPGFTKGNEYVARDEALHVTNYINFILYHSEQLGKLERKRVVSTISGAVDLAIAMFDYLLPHDIPSCKWVARSMHELVRLFADDVLVELGYDRHFNVPVNEMYVMMKAVDTPQFTSFHTTVPTEYARAAGELNFEDVFN